MDVVILELPAGDQLEFQIALVEEPAIESNFMAFSKEARFQFKEIDKTERKLMGYFMIADLEILRVDDKRGAFKVKFPKKSIDQIVENFSFNGLNKNMNENHQTGKLADGVYVLNHWQMDSAKGIKAPDGFKTEADGSWFGVVKCDNDEIYQKALDGTFKGFSIESKFIEKAIDKYFKTDIDNFLDNLKYPNTGVKNLYNKYNKMTKEVKEIFEAVKAYFSEKDIPLDVKPVDHKFEDLMLADGATKVTIEPAVEVGAAIVMYDAEGNPVPAPIGSYELQDGRVIVVEADGVVASITEAAAEGEEMSDDLSPESKESKAVAKRLIETISKTTEFSKDITDLKAENEKLKLENADLRKLIDHANNETDELKTQFSELKEFSKNTLEEIKTLLGKEESKAPVQPVKRGFKLEKKESMYPFLNKKQN